MIEIKASALPEGIKVDVTMNSSIESLVLESGAALLAIHRKLEAEVSPFLADVYKKGLRDEINNDDFWDGTKTLSEYEEGGLS